MKALRKASVPCVSVGIAGIYWKLGSRNADADETVGLFEDWLPTSGSDDTDAAELAGLLGGATVGGNDEFVSKIL